MADSRGRDTGATSVWLITSAVVCLTAVTLLVTMVLSVSGAPATTTSTAVAAPVVQSVQPVADQIVPVAERIAPVVTVDPVSTDWVALMSARTGISAVAVDAYGRASLRLQREQTGCRLGWTTLAGIGGIESEHGTNSGSHLLADGTTSRPIIGPALDGTDGNAAIRSDEQSVKWHGDARWDHAVGPLQFIPSTWEKWGSDGDGDGVADPHDKVDAAYAAARYLCASGADLSTGAGWSRAIFSYNHSDDYVRSVLARANSYAPAR